MGCNSSVAFLHKTVFLIKTFGTVMQLEVDSSFIIDWMALNISKIAISLRIYHVFAFWDGLQGLASRATETTFSKHFIVIFRFQSLASTAKRDV